MHITSNSVLPPLVTLTPMLASVLTPYLKSVNDTHIFIFCAHAAAKAEKCSVPAWFPALLFDRLEFVHPFMCAGSMKVIALNCFKEDAIAYPFI